VDEARKVSRSECLKVSFSGQEASDTADGILDAALLPRRMWIAEEGLQVDAFVQAMMLGKLGSVVECQGSAELSGHEGEELGDGIGGRVSAAVVGADDRGEAGSAFVQHQDGLSEAGEQHEVGFPVAGLAAITSFLGALLDGQAELDREGGAAAAGGSPPPPRRPLALGR